jgi:cathepsin X
MTFKNGYRSEVWSKEQEAAHGVVYNGYTLPTPAEYVKTEDLPDSYNWGNVNGVNYLTKSLNQHIPQYCGSCWAHGAISALADRVKIARNASGVDIIPSIQFILNCGDAGSCHGGSHVAVYQFLKNERAKDGAPYDTCQPYVACSSEMETGLCKGNTEEFKCSGINTCRTCPTFGEPCVALDHYPNVTVAEYGTLAPTAEALQKEIMTRGPIACGIDASQILEYKGGVATGMCGGIDHVISVVGWGSENGEQYWIVRNSWGEYWGELGYIRVKFGSLCVEAQCAWATPKAWTEHNFPCYEGGENCQASKVSHYVDPAHKIVGGVF